MKIRFLALILLTATLQAGEPTEAELARLQHALEEANSQADMNMASRDLAEYWDRVLEREETRVLAACDADQAKLFQKAQKLWRAFRNAEVEFQGDSSRGGSIQPLIHNTTYAALTERRVKELQSSSEMH
ncbi:MAG: DUF1311 domain-containing protein [Chthoniobacterales bacterium]|nr:DUF1311 domain-containing protein [Chthoniobacterales bacterium]